MLSGNGASLILVASAFALLLSASGSADDSRTLKVIGAGQGRTGTESLRLALNKLGVGPTYHMSQLLGIDASRPVSPLEMLGLVEGHNDYWANIEDQIAEGSPGSKLDWSFLGDYNSTLDLPAAAYFPQLLEANPGAKVILTVRDPKKVYESSKNTWCRLIGASGGSTVDYMASVLYSLRPYGRRFFRMHAAMGRATARTLDGFGDIEYRHFSWQRVCGEEGFGVTFFQNWNELVKSMVPPEQLLIFETGKHGYKELSNFLGVEMPPSGTEYSRMNSSADFAFVLNIMRALAVLTVVCPLCILQFLGRKLLGWGRKPASKEN